MLLFSSSSGGPKPAKKPMPVTFYDLYGRQYEFRHSSKILFVIFIGYV
jgi:hypothetical protein